jgi:hypothetical protein
VLLVSQQQVAIYKQVHEWVQKTLNDLPGSLDIENESLKRFHDSISPFHGMGYVKYQSNNKKIFRVKNRNLPKETAGI